MCYNVILDNSMNVQSALSNQMWSNWAKTPNDYSCKETVETWVEVMLDAGLCLDSFHLTENLIVVV